MLKDANSCYRVSRYFAFVFAYFSGAMKILGGFLKGKNFFMPKGIRPTQDVIRKAIFDILGQDLDGLEFIDLFAGSGSMAIEAFSRGAKRVVCVEKDLRCAKVIQENMALLKIPFEMIDPPALVIQGDVFWVIKHLGQPTGPAGRQGRKFDIAFLDPPFETEMAKKALKTLTDHDILRPVCFIMVQHSKREILPEDSGRFSIVRQKKYGSSILSVYEGKQ